VLVVAGVGLAVGIAAWLGGAWVALGVFVALVLGIGFGFYLRSDATPRERAVWERTTTQGEQRRILVVANETLSGAPLLAEIGYRARGYHADVLVVAPALSSHVRYWASDVDGGRAHAQERLDASLAALGTVGIRARGEIGDSDPLQAMEDALRTFGADEIIVSTHPPGRSNWLERDVVAHARERFAVPITHVVVDLDRENAASA